MMDNEIDRELLEKIADMLGKPVGAFNIRKDSGCDGRQSTEHIEITSKTDGKSGIDIRIKDGTVGETCHIPVIITKSGIEEMVYNDFYIGENCNVDIVAGCGIHNCGDQTSRHDGLHTFYVGKNSHVHYTEKHYGEGDGKGGRIMNPQTVVYLEEGASILARNSQLMIFDEPEAGIDLWSFARLTETFEQIHANGSATMIIISLADEVIVVGDGAIRHRGSASEILPQILADTLGGCPVLTKEVTAQ